MATTTGAKPGRDDTQRGSNGEGMENKDLTSDIQQLRQDIAQLTDHVMEVGNRSVSRARRMASQQADQIRGSAEDFQDDVIESVREKPLTALALAAGAGFLLAMIMRR